MRHNIALVTVLFALMPSAAKAEESSWIFQPSYYSHSPVTGQRVVQYQPEQPAFVPYDPTYQQSGYRHDHTSIHVGNSQDDLHIVQTWGQPVRPYGEWEYPFRAGATPFGPWGNPQGPWTLPFDSWQNPYGLGRYYGSPWGASPMPYPRTYAGPQMSPLAGPGTRGQQPVPAPSVVPAPPQPAVPGPTSL